jgi:hypothetical protein
VKNEKDKFNIEFFMKLYAQKQIRTETVSTWIEIDLRYVQRWAKKNNVGYKRNHGRKYYDWNENDVRQFAEYYNRKNKSVTEIKKQKKKDIHKVKFKTITDYTGDDRSGKRLREVWAKNHNIPRETHFGRKYYIWSKETEDAFQKRLHQKHYLKRNIKYGSLYIGSCFTSDVDSKIIRQWAERHRLPYITNCKKYTTEDKRDMVRYDLITGDRVKHISEPCGNIDSTVWQDIQTHRKAYIWDREAIKNFIKAYMAI